MKLSVILPCYNGASTIAQQMDALCRQSWTDDWEVVVSNNGSTDESMAIVEEYRDRLPELRIVSAYTPPGPRLGVSHSYNVGFRAATGDAFVLCESDDEVGDGWLEAMGRALEEHEFVVAQMEYRRLNSEWMIEPVGANPQEAELPQIEFPPFLNYAWGCSFGLRRSLYERLGGFDEAWRYACDAEFCFRVQGAGIPIQLVHGARVHYRLRSSFPALARQQRNWGEEFSLLVRSYGAATARYAGIRQAAKVAGIAARGTIVIPPFLLRLPNGRRNVYFWVKSLAWESGAIRGVSRPVAVDTGRPGDE